MPVEASVATLADCCAVCWATNAALAATVFVCRSVASVDEIPIAVAFVVIWLRVSNPRLRADQLQRLAWQVLVPVTLAQLALTGVVKVVMS